MSRRVANLYCLAALIDLPAAVLLKDKPPAVTVKTVCIVAERMPQSGLVLTFRIRFPAGKKTDGSLTIDGKTSRTWKKESGGEYPVLVFGDGRHRITIEAMERTTLSDFAISWSDREARIREVSCK